MDLKEELLKGNKLAAAKLITLLENKDEKAFGIIAECFDRTGSASVIGVTGPPGAGKSTLIDKLTKELRKTKKRVGVVAVDPTSLFTGGAILGDRVRMSDLATDDGVFIRSLAARGALGGISRAVFGAVKVLDILGMDYIFVETVGVGQSEIDIVRVADMVIVTVVPGLGDEIQGLKAGIFEIADLIVVNKADREDADRTCIQIKSALELNPDKSAKNPAVIKAVAIDGTGVADVLDGIGKYIAGAKDDGSWETRRREAVRHEMMSTAEELFFDNIERGAASNRTIEGLIEKIIQKELDPHSAAKSLLQRLQI